MTGSNVSMKLLIDTQNKKVLFAEAGKDCVDFLFHILSLPIATVIRLLTKQEMPGSVANLYESIENLNESYMQPGRDKDILLKPISLAHGVASVPLLLLNDAPTERAPTERKFYKCRHGHCSYFSDDDRAVCRSCNQNLNSQITYVAPPTPSGGQASLTEGGFVKAVVTYMVMDDLVVKPMSTISSITLLNSFNVKDVRVLQEKEVTVGMTEAVNLLKICLHSKNVLTDVFLNKN